MGRITPILIAIRKNLSDDLLKLKYRNIANRKPTTGHCYVAAEALYHLLSLKQKEKFKPYHLNINGETHWFLMTKDKLDILDPTYDQFNALPNYDHGKRAAFLTKNPSKRTLILLKRIKNGKRLGRKKIIHP